MKYKVGDKVRIKSIDWYNENKNRYGNIRCSDMVYFAPNMSEFCDSIVTIKDIDIVSNAYEVEENEHYWTNNMIEENVEETSLKGKFGLWENKINGILFSNENYADKVELRLGDDYEIVIEDGRTFVQKKKPKYPTTYDECCKILGIDSGNFITIRNLYCIDGEEIITDYEDTLKDKFGVLWKLLICRDAYWKIAGEQMGLGEFWKPDWNESKPKDTIVVIENKLVKSYALTQNYILAFPTEEMRDAFYENFKELIKSCKELL